MNTQIESSKIEDGQATRNTERKFFLYAAAISTLFGIVYFLGLMGKLFVNGNIHAQSSPAISMISAAIGLLWVVTLVILFVALRRLLPRRSEIYADLGLVFMVLLAASSSVNWYVQLTLVPKITQSGDTLLLSLIDIHNVNSIVYAMEHLSWSLFYGLATIFMALAIGGTRMDTWIRWLLIAGGVMSILYIPGIMIANQFLIDLGYYAAGVLLPLTTILLIIRFRK